MNAPIETAKDEKICDMDGVREYAECYGVELYKEKNGRLCVLAKNEAGLNCTMVDLLDVLEWVKRNPSVLSG